MGLLEYSSNNSGGNFWLTDKDWKNLEKAGWIVHWVHDSDDPSHTHAGDEDDWADHQHRHSYTDPLVPSVWNGERWLEAAATTAAIATDDPDKAVEEFERITGRDVSAKGCSCCGSPHSFAYTDLNDTLHFLYTDIIKRWS
jgi:hypothetical protein